MKLFLNVIVVAIGLHLSVALKHTESLFTNHLRSLKSPPSKAVRGEAAETKWIQQRINNFDRNDVRVWPMRYMENNYFLKDGGPIFIFVGGEVEIDEGWLLGGHLHDMAAQLQGVIFYVEHRYYGKSRPTADTSTENLQFLSVGQALADLAQFIVHVKQTNVLLANSSVILMGASYSATLTTWFMEEYPTLANGAWVSSAPLKAQLDFFEYSEIVSYAIETAGGKECSNRIKRAFKELEQLFATKELTRVTKLFNLCYPLNASNKLDIANFFTGVINAFYHVVQTHQSQSKDIQKMCSMINDNSIPDDAIEALSKWWSSQGSSCCFNHLYGNFVDTFNQSKWDDDYWFGVRQWTYQTCNEFGWFQTTNSNKTLFGSSVGLPLSLQTCTDFFGPNFSQKNIQESVDRTNRIYRATNPDVRHVYSTHGQFDPWHAMGVHGDINLFSPTTVISNESHCSDLYSVSWTDSPELRASKERIFELVQQWILL